jgi:hypothetical protein
VSAKDKFTTPKTKKKPRKKHFSRKAVRKYFYGRASGLLKR